MKLPLLLSTLFAGILLTTSAAGADPLAAGKPAECEKTYKVRELDDITYYDGKLTDLFRHKLDIFVPKDKKDFPVVVFLHGGCWTIGDKSCCGLYSAIGRFLASHGIGAVFPNYRLSPWVKHPEHIKDVARAFAWTHNNIARYGGDPNQMFIGGHSAGGHLAALLTTDEEYLKAEGLSRKDIRGVIAVSGVYRIPDKLEFAWETTSFGAKIEVKTNPFDFIFPKDPKGREAASPICHVAPGLPPFLIAFAESDLPLLPDMAAEFTKTLRDNKCEVELLKIEDRNHNNIAFKAINTDDPLGKAMLDFVRQHSGK